MQSPPFIQSNQENHSKTSYLGLAVRVGGVSGWLGRLSTASEHSPIDLLSGLVVGHGNTREVDPARARTHHPNKRAVLYR